MKISTRGRYALRVMVYLAEHDEGNLIPLKEISDSQNISLKYLEGIMSELSKAEIVEARHGKGGGYRLMKPPEECTADEVLNITEDGLAPVACLSAKAEPCPKSGGCKTLKMWSDFYKLTQDFFGGITIADLVKEDKNYEI